MDLLGINIFYQYLVDYLLIIKFQLLIFSMEDMEYIATLDNFD